MTDALRPEPELTDPFSPYFKTGEPMNPKKHEWRGDGWRFHTPIWTSKGTFCSEPECEVNKRRSR